MHGSSLRDINSMCRSLLAFLRVYGDCIRETGGPQRERGPDGHPRPFDTTPTAIMLITRSLVSLADDGIVVLADDTPAGRLAVALRGICEGLPLVYFDMARQHLQKYAFHLQGTQADCFLEDGMNALVGAERRLAQAPRPPHDTLGQVPEAAVSLLDRSLHAQKSNIPCFVLR